MVGPQLAVLGNLILDDVVLHDGETRMGQAGGAALYVALGAALWQVEIGVVSIVGQDYPAPILDSLAGRGVDLAGIHQIDGPSLRTWLLYEGRRRRVVHRLDGPTHARVSPSADQLPAAWQPRIYHLAPMPFRVQRELAAALATQPGATLSLDPFELVREDALPRWHRLLANVDLLFLSEDEMELPGGLADPETALRRLGGSSPRLQQVIYKQGARGGIAWDPQTGRSRPWQPLPVEVTEPTGAGDAFAGGLLAGRLLGDSERQATFRGLVSASFALAGPGAEGLLAATPAVAAARLDALTQSPPRV